MTKHNIIPTRLAVKAMRDSGYKNAAYAIAELIDNAIEAQASQVDLLCAETEQYLTQRSRMRLHEIAVLDNGEGMNADVLRMALQFGNGTHLETKNQQGMGRFGMGLPNSSISQARRVDVWSWEKSIKNAIHTYIDVDEIEDGDLEEVPEPKQKDVPSIWMKVGYEPGKTGTLVVWSKIDRCMWRTGRTIIDNSEFLIGRIYRRFLTRGDVQIRMVSFDVDKPKGEKYEIKARPNDPLYLMENTSCPAPWSDEPMFEPWGDDTPLEIKFKGESHLVKMRFSYAKEEARSGHNPGAEPYGKHAAKNVGVSIIRAERELDLDSNWSNPSEPRDRWWGVELEFPPTLDNLFGVTNNKQSVRIFSDLAKVDLETLLEEGQSLGSLKAELEADEDPRLPLLEIANHIQKNINSIRRLVKAQTEGKRRRHPGATQPTEAIATEATEKRKADGFTGESDQQEELPEPERKEEIKKALTQQGITRESAEELAALTVGRGFKYTFANADINSPAFFDVKSRGGAVIVSLNTNHPAYTHLVEVLEHDIEGEDLETLQGRLENARDGLELLLMAWARYEDEQPDGPRRNKVQEARWDWGRIARQFLNDEC